MNDEKIIEAMARLEGLELPTGLMYDGTDLRGAIAKRGGDLVHVPDYLTSHDAVQRVIDGLTPYEVGMVFDQLMFMNMGIIEMLQATPRQKCEAVLKAKGLWGEST